MTPGLPTASHPQLARRFNLLQATALNMTNMVGIGIGLAAIWLLYRKTDAIAKIAVSLWIGTLLTTAAVIITGALHFDRKLAFDFPPGAFHLSGKFLLGLGAACRFGMYDYLGYYDICYIGDEVKNPGKVIPRSIIISVAGVGLLYLGWYLSLIVAGAWVVFVSAEG